MEQLEATEISNRGRLDQVIHACEQILQRLVRETFDLQQHSFGMSWLEGEGLTRAYPKLMVSLRPHQRDAARGGEVTTWDVSLCKDVLNHMRAFKGDKAKLSAVNAVAAAHFTHHYSSASHAFKELGGDVAILQQIRDRAAAVSDAEGPELVPSNEADTQRATDFKAEGNQLFKAKDFQGAERAYTEGIRLGGVIDSFLLSRLYNNRAITRLHLEDLNEAKHDAKRASELAPQWAKPHLRLAEIYHRMFQHSESVDRLEVALGLAQASQDAAVENEIKKKMAEYRLLRQEEVRRETENLAFSPLHTHEGPNLAARQAMQGLQGHQNPNTIADRLLEYNGLDRVVPGMKHILKGHRAMNNGRTSDAAGKYKAAALAGNPLGMYIYANMLLKGQGVNQNIPDGVRWLEKAAAMPESEYPEMNTGIADAMNSLGDLYNEGIYLDKDETCAREYWERATERGEKAVTNDLALCLAHGTNGMKVDLPRARDLFRRSAEMRCNEAMVNLADLHASLQEFETAVRWADAARSFGYEPAAEKARKYREMVKKRKDLPAGLMDKIDEITALFSEITVKPSPKRTNKVPPVEELRTIGIPYCKRLLSAKETMIQACSLNGSDLDELAEAVRLAADAYRIEDDMIVFTTEEKHTASVAAKKLMDAGFELTPDMALCSSETDPSSFVTYWKSMQLKFPDDLTITRRAASSLMFSAYPGADHELGVHLFGKAFSLLPRLDDDSDPATMGLLYEAGAAYFLSNQISFAYNCLTRFLKHAEVDGHRKASEARFMLGIMILRQALPDAVAPESLKVKDLQSENLDVKAREHLERGIALEGCLPDFLRDGHESQERKSLERILRAKSMMVSPVSSQALDCGGKRGGELLSGPRRHSKLRANELILNAPWRKSISRFAGDRANTDVRRELHSVVPPRSSTGHESLKSAVPATIDELFSALKDQVYKERSVECIVVSTPISTGSSFQMIVEDSQREPARLAIYNSTPSLVKQLVPGRVLVLLNPYVRIAGDASIMLRVDNPSDTLQVKAKHSICWVCSVEDQSDQRLKHCAKCNEAFYCSKKCQKDDRAVYGHRYLCSSFSSAP